MANIKKGTKITVLGAGNVGASIAYTLMLSGLCSDIVLVDINKGKAEGEAMDIRQGVTFSNEVSVSAGGYEDAKDSDIVIVSLGIGRKPGQTRIDLAQTNVNIIKSVMPQIVEHAPDAIYVVVSNPVDIITYTILKTTNLPANRVIGTGTLLDSSRLRACLASYADVNTRNVHAYIFGEHGDSLMIPWSLASVGCVTFEDYCENIGICHEDKKKEVEEAVRTAGAAVISRKGATYYAIAATVKQVCESIIRDDKSVLTVSNPTNGKYGTEDVCLSLPYFVGADGITRDLNPKLTEAETEKLIASSKALKEVIDALAI